MTVRLLKAACLSVAPPLRKGSSIENIGLVKKKTSREHSELLQEIGTVSHSPEVKKGRLSEDIGIVPEGPAVKKNENNLGKDYSRI